MPEQNAKAVDDRAASPGSGSGRRHPRPGRGPGHAASATSEQHRLLKGAERGGQRRRDRLDRARREVLTRRDAVIAAADNQDRAATKAVLSTAKADQIRQAGRGRSIGLWVSLSVTAAAVGLLWVVDSNLLVTLLLGHFATRLVTGVLVAASAVTAHLAGALSREKHLAVFPAIELGPFKLQLLCFCLIAGPSLEVGLGVLRAAGTGALLSSLLLAVAGVAIWAGLALLAYASHSPVENAEARDTRSYNRSTKGLIRQLDNLERCDVTYRSQRRRYQDHAQRTVDEIDIVTTQAVQHAHLEELELDLVELARTAALREVAKGELRELEVAPFTVPRIRLIALCDHPSPSLPPAEPRALPPAGGWR